MQELARLIASDNIVIGGGIALKHYVDHRPTQDIDAWWKSAREENDLNLVREAMKRTAKAHNLSLREKRFGATDSIELVDDKSRKVFSFQIAVRDKALDEPIDSAWPPLKIETLRDNIGSKMNALVQRGAPRDFVDIYELVASGLTTATECWELWAMKNDEANIESAKALVAAHLRRLEGRRPLDSILNDAERSKAGLVRRWFSDAFLRIDPNSSGCQNA